MYALGLHEWERSLFHTLVKVYMYLEKLTEQPINDLLIEILPNPNQTLFMIVKQYENMHYLHAYPVSLHESVGVLGVEGGKVEEHIQMAGGHTGRVALAWRANTTGGSTTEGFVGKDVFGIVIRYERSVGLKKALQTLFVCDKKEQ